MAIRLNDNIGVIAPKPSDDRYFNNLQPYATTGDVNTIIISDRRYIGLTVNVNGEEYWYQSGTTDTDLVKKIGADGSGVVGATNGLTNTDGIVKLGGELTETTTITDSRATKTGIEYGADYSATFTDRSLVDKGYVTSVITPLSDQISDVEGDLSSFSATTVNDISNLQSDLSSFSATTVNDITNLEGDVLALSGSTLTGATNGLTKDGKNAVLGGALDRNTNINLNGFDLALTASTSASTVTLNSLTYVDGNQGDGKILASYADGRAYWADVLESELITGATNGLTKEGDVVVLGGNLEQSTVIFDNRTTKTGIEYGADYSATFTDRSLIDKGYVDAAITGGVSSAVTGGTNGLTLDGKDIKLGGVLTENTTITDGRVTKTGIEYGADYSATFTDRSLVDKGYVTNVITPLSNDITNLEGDVLALSGSTLTGATNGLTKDGKNAVLGGALDRDTTISGTNTFEVSAPLTLSNTQRIIFNDAADNSGHVEGRLYYDNGALNIDMGFPGVTLQLGEEQVVRVSNATGDLIPNGTPVYINGSSSGLPTIGLAQGIDGISEKTIGLTTLDIAENDEGYVTILGVVRSVDTSAYTVGTQLYVSPTVAGTLTAVKPTYPHKAVRIGNVLNVGVSGEILVDVRCETEFTEVGTFTGYTATTQTVIENKLDSSTFNTYTGSTETRLTDIELITDLSVTGLTNGLTKVNDHLGRLGGNLTQNTTISGGTYSLSIGDMNGLNLSTKSSSDIQVNAKDGGGVYLKAQNVGSNNTTPSNYSNSIGISMDYDSAHGFIVYDNRVGSNAYGIEYASDYSENYSERSLVDKAYVDSIATGLAAKQAVTVATTENITLSGTPTIDGVVVSDGMRVLVKDQTDATLNGIYVVSGGTWTRSDDYNFNPSGEISNGDLVPVLSGNSNINTQWILTSPDPVVSGDTLNFSKFSQLLEIAGGDGIAINTIAGVRNISVDLASDSALHIVGGKLSFDYTRLGLGLSNTGSVININAVDGVATGSEIPVRIDSSAADMLYVDSAAVITAISPVTTASNGLTKTGTNIELGGSNLTKDTTISGNGGAFDLSLTGLDSFNVEFDNVSLITDNGSNGGIRYAADYSTNYTDRSLVDKAYVINAVTGSTLTFQNGLTKTGSVIELGGNLSKDTSILYGASRLRFLSSGGIECINVVSDCSRLHVENTYAQLCSCTNSLYSGSISVCNSGAISLSTNNATQGITVTDTGSGKGIVYAGDYTPTLVANSLITKGYVDSLRSVAITGVTNGISSVNNVAELGGGLSKNTAIGLGSNSLAFTAGTTSYSFNQTALNLDIDNVSVYATNAGTGYINLEILNGPYVDLGVTTNVAEIGSSDSYIKLSGTTTEISSPTIKLMNTPVTGANSDLILVWNSTDKQVKTINGGAVLNAAITGATNGLTKDGQNVKLGGVLTEITTITDTINGRGIEYADDYSTTFVDRSLIDKGYVDTITNGLSNQISDIITDVSATITGATNGLTKDGKNAVLGGVLDRNTNINLNGFDLVLTASTSASTVTLNSLTYVDGNQGDGKLLVSDANGYASWGNVIESELITGATNGLTKSGDVVVLGGALTGTTIITDAVNGKGIEYGADYSATFVDRSLVDKGYVDTVVSGGVSSAITGATNGLTKVGQDVVLGGTLAEYTEVFLNSNTFNFNGGNVYAQFDDMNDNISLSTCQMSLLMNGLTNTLSLGFLNNGGNLCIDDSSKLICLYNISTTHYTDYGVSISNDCISLNTPNSSASISVDGTNNYITLDGSVLLTCQNVGTTSDSVLVWNSTDKKIKTISGSELGEDNNVYTNRIVTGSTLVGAGDYVILVNHSAAVIVSLPTTPVDGQAVKIKDVSGNAITNNITIDGNGNSIDSAVDTTALINTDYGAIELMYDATIDRWVTLSFII